MSEGHRSILLRTDPYKTKQKNRFLPCWKRIKKMKQEQETEQKVC